jgi:hypothetical protein
MATHWRHSGMRDQPTGWKRKRSFGDLEGLIQLLLSYLIIWIWTQSVLSSKICYVQITILNSFEIKYLQYLFFISMSAY